MKIKLRDSDLHPHIIKRMQERGVTRKEIEETLEKGTGVDDARAGTLGKVYVFPYRKKWIGRLFEEKEVRVYYKYIRDKITLLSKLAKCKFQL